jgi:hypothetical protein
MNKFTPDSFNHPDGLLEGAARLTLRLVLQCDWVEGYTHDHNPDDHDDPKSWSGLYIRIHKLMRAYVRGPEGKGETPEWLLARFAYTVAYVIANMPSLRAAVAADLATKPDDDP